MTPLEKTAKAFMLTLGFDLDEVSEDVRRDTLNAMRAAVEALLKPSDETLPELDHVGKDAAGNWWVHANGKAYLIAELVMLRALLGEKT